MKRIDKLKKTAVCVRVPDKVLDLVDKCAMAENMTRIEWINKILRFATCNGQMMHGVK